VPRLWDLSRAAQQEKLGPQMAAVTGLAWLPGKNTLLVASGERLRPEKAGELKAFHFGPQPPPGLCRLDSHGIWSLGVAAAGPTIAWGGGSRGVWAWNITRQEPRLFRQSGQSLAVAISPDGNILAAAADRSVRLWDVPRGRELALLEGHKGLVSALAFSPDGRTLATGGRDQQVRFWSVGEGIVTPRRSYEWPAGAVYTLAFSADGLLAAAAGASGTVVIWDVDE
jgi:WD40 repeat protein